MDSTSTSNTLPRIVLIDDHAIVRHAIRTIIEGSGDFTVVGEADSCSSALSLIKELLPDIAIVDLGLPGKSGIELLLEIREAKLPIKPVVLTMYDDEQRFRQSLRAGARAYLLKSLAPQEFIEALRLVSRGGEYIPQRLQHFAESGAGDATAESSDDPLVRLSKREREIFYFLAEGLPNRAIAKKLFISPRTVETHRARVLKKFGFHSTAELIRFALRNHLLSA